jgi:hypothetical protein
LALGGTYAALARRQGQSAGSDAGNVGTDVVPRAA